jgi:hypothetical protein
MIDTAQGYFVETIKEFAQVLGLLAGGEGDKGTVLDAEWNGWKGWCRCVRHDDSPLLLKELWCPCGTLFFYHNSLAVASWQAGRR